MLRAVPSWQHLWQGHHRTGTVRGVGGFPNPSPNTLQYENSLLTLALSPTPNPNPNSNQVGGFCPEGSPAARPCPSGRFGNTSKLTLTLTLAPTLAA